MTDIQQHDEFFHNGTRYYTQEQLDAAVAEARADRRHGRCLLCYAEGQQDAIASMEDQSYAYKAWVEEGEKRAITKAKQIADGVIATDDGTSTASHAMRYLLTMLGGDE